MPHAPSPPPGAGPDAAPAAVRRGRRPDGAAATAVRPVRLEGVQMLRAAAALTVVFFHLPGAEILATGGAEGDRLPVGLARNGFAGVDLFFVISGFVMAYITGPEHHTARGAQSFMFARLLRVYPLHWVFAGLAALWVLVVHVALNRDGLGWSAFGGGEVAPALHLAGSFALAPMPVYPVWAVAWTLVHEVFFYAVFAALLLLPRRALAPALGAWAALCVVAAVLRAGRLGADEFIAGNWFELAVHPLNLEFIGGAFAALLFRSGRRWRPALLSAVAALWFALALSLFGTILHPHSLMMGRVLWFGLPCILLVYAVASLEAEGRLAWLGPALAGAVAAGIAGSLLYPAGPAIAGQTVWHAAVRDGAEGVPWALLPGLAAGTAEAALWPLAAGLAGWAGAAALLLRVGGAAARLGGAFGRAGSALGDWSYSLYLSHVAVLIVGIRVWELALGWAAARGLPIGNLRVGAEGLIGNALWASVSVIACVLAAFLCFRLIERPVMRWSGAKRRRLFPDAPRTAPEVRPAIW